MALGFLTLTDSIWQSAYVNFSLALQIKSCNHHNQFSVEDKSNQQYEQPVSEDGTNAADSDSILGRLTRWLDWGDPNIGDADENDKLALGGSVREDCADLINSHLGGSASIVTLMQAVFVVLTFLVLLPLIFKRARRYRIQTGYPDKETSTVNQLAEKDQVEDTQAELTLNPETVDPGSQEQTSDLHELNVPSKLQTPVVIPMHKCSSAKLCPDILTKPDTMQLLSHTVDHFLSELDRVLGLTAAETLPSSESLPTFSANATPRLERKGSLRRPKWRSPHSLPLGAASVSPGDKTAVRMWHKVEEIAQGMKWSGGGVGEIDITLVQDNRLSAVLQFYQKSCPVRTEQWNAACLIVNYVLCHLKHELMELSAGDSGDCLLQAGSHQRHLLRVLDLHSFGSAANGTCISRSDRFDAMMVLQMSSCREMTVYHWGINEEIPAGRVVLGVKEHTVTNTLSSNLLIKDRIGDSFGLFLSQKEVLKAAHKMVANALERLKLKGKGSLDRLPFNLHLSAFDNLLLRIDTKMLNGLGLGVSEITVRLTPCLRVSTPDCEPLPVLYAVPPWGSTSTDESSAPKVRLQTRIMRNRSQGVPPEMLWQLNCTELTQAFMSAADNRLVSAGVSGCQIMCQQILRALFSRSGKDNLLTSGEVHPHILDTVVYFLLLESPPESWSLSSLPDRLSDCIHFLRSAVQSAWMPDFHLHNPHLLKQMPALKLLPLLNVGRQENLLTSVRPDVADTIQAFMDARLQETGLRKCLKTEYSSEMWEYEFFIFG